MAHSHGHDHQGQAHRPANYGRAFVVGTTLNVGFIIIEVIYGIVANSVALLADAGHNLGFDLFPRPDLRFYSFPGSIGCPVKWSHFAR